MLKAEDRGLRNERNDALCDATGDANSIAAGQKKTKPIIR
jgi:hypothetical protein